MKNKNKRLIVVVALLAALDVTGFITMVANPDLTARVIPALVGVQILAFLAIAAIILRSKEDYTAAAETDSGPGGKGKQWVPWLFGFLALVSFLRVGLALLYIAGAERHRHSWIGPIAGTAMGCFFLWLAILAGRSGSKATPSNPGA